MSFSDVEHYSVMLAGCEAINTGNRTAPEAHYAFAVLKLHAQDNSDFGSHAGQEGFLDSVKKGASNTLEFVKKLFEAIKAWFADVFKTSRGKFKSFFSGNDEEKQKKLQAIRGTMITKVEAVKSGATGTPEGVDGKEVIDKGDKLIAALKEGVPAGVALGMDDFLSAIDRLETKFVSYVGSKTPKGTEPHAEYNKAVQAFKKFSTPVNAMTVYISSLDK